MKLLYVKFSQLIEEKKVTLVTPSFKVQTNKVYYCGEVPAISQDKDFIVGYVNQEDPKLKEPPYILFGDHTECFKYIDFNFVQCSDGLKIIKVDPNYIVPKYLYYALLLSYCKAGFYERHFKLLKHTQIPLYSLDVQKKIVDLLSNYDEQISINARKIKLLKEEIYELFKEWFIRFRFSNNQIIFKDTTLGRIPNDFKIEKMKNVIDDYIGGGWGEETKDKMYSQDAYVIRGADFPYVSNGEAETCVYRYHKVSNYKQRKLEEDDIIIEISGGTEEKPVGRTIIVTKGILDKLDNKAICASFCKRLKINNKMVSSVYFHFWMNYLYETRIIDRYQLQSTGISNFKFEYFLKKCDIIIPPEKLMNKFTDIAYDMLREIDILANQNRNLLKQQNMLLPRLISGKIEVQ